MQLRPYQTQALGSVRDMHDGDHRFPLMVLPTGTGKTITALHLVHEYMGRGQRVLWVAHRQELIDQPILTIASIWPELIRDTGVVKARQNEYDKQLVFASMDTIRNPDRLYQLLDAGPVDLVIVDEAHHSASLSWDRVLDAIDAHGGEGCHFLGLTATPDRADGKPLGKRWKVASHYPLYRAIEDGWLVPCEIEQNTLTGLSDILDEVPSWGSDFDTAALSDAIIEAKIVQHTGAVMARHAHSKKAIVFTVTVKQAELTVQELTERGFRAEVVHGDLPRRDRARILSELKRGDLDCVANCAVLTEGYDEPSVDCILLARPSRSKPLFLQMIGRGLRLHPGKDHMLLLDLVGASSEHELIQAPALLEEEEEKGEGGEGTQHPKRTYSGLVGERFRGRCSWIELHDLSPPVWVADAAWEGTVALLMAPSSYRDVDDSPMWVPWLMRRSRGKPPTREGLIKLAETPVSLQMATGIGTDFVRKSGAALIADENADWRALEPSDKQLESLRKWRIEADTEGMTKGEVSDLLTRRIATVDLLRVGLCDEVW